MIYSPKFKLSLLDFKTNIETNLHQKFLVRELNENT